MTSQSPQAERAWWDSLKTEELEAHVAGPEASPADLIEALEPIHAAMNEGGTILDLGCGYGRITNALAEGWTDASFVGLDISPLMIGRAREHPARNTAYRVGDGRHIPGHEMFDGAFSLFCFQHIPHEAVGGYLLELEQRLIPYARLRFQYVEGTAEPAFLNCQHDYYDDIAPALSEAGFSVLDIDRGLLHPEWTWITAEARP